MTRLKWKFVSVHLEIVLILMRDGCTVCAERTIGSELFCTHPMELICDVGHVKSCFSPFGYGVSVSARQVHILRQIEKSFWIHPIVLLGDEAQVKACLGSFGHSANLDTRLLHSLRRMYDRLRNRLDTPDGTPR
jgi:hypothetical protein